MYDSFCTFPCIKWHRIRHIQASWLQKSWRPRLLRLDLWYKFYFQHSNVFYFWNQNIGHHWHLTSRYLTTVPFDDKNVEAHEEFQIFDAKIIFLTFDDEKFNNKKLDPKMDFQTIHVKEFQSFPKHNLKDLNCHKVGGGRAARRRRRKNVACFSKCRKWNFWRLERCCCCCLLLEENPSKQAGEINVVKLLELQGGIWNSSLSWLEPVHSMYRAPQQEISGDSDSYQNAFRWSKGSFRFINLKTFRAFRGFLCYKQIF